MRRAKHVVQSLKLGEVVPAPQTREEARDLFTKEVAVERNENVLLMEYCQNGDLHSLIEKCVLKEHKVGAKHLWSIFACRKI